MQYNQDGTYNRTMEPDRAYNYRIKTQKGPKRAAPTGSTRNFKWYLMDITNRGSLERYATAVSAIPNVP